MNKARLREHLEKLATFKSVADLKSVRKASARLALTQPAVSRTIKVLEDVLECRLMVREAHGIRLTEEGERLYDFAKLIEKNLQNLDFGSKVEASIAKPFKVATYDNIAIQNLSTLLKDLALEIHHISISVGGPNSKILGNLIAGEFDCALVAQPRILPGITYKKIFKERYGLFASRRFLKKNRIEAKKSFSAEDLKSFHLIAMPEAIAGVDKNIDRLLWEVGLERSLSVNSYEVGLQLILEGVGIGIIPFSTAWRKIQEDYLQELRVKDVAPLEFGLHDLVICWNAKANHPAIPIFIQKIEDYFGRIKS